MAKISVLTMVLLLGLGCGSDIQKKSDPENNSNNPTPNNSNNPVDPNNPSATNNTSGTNNENNPIIIVEPVEGEVSLIVQSAQQVGAESYAIEISIANGLEESISIAPSTFRIGIGGLELTSVNSNQSTCSSNALVSPDGTVDCILVFEDIEGTPDRLIYAGAGDLVVASFTPRACETCGGGTCVDLRTSREHCGECNHSLISSEICEDGNIACDSGYRLEEGFCVYSEDFFSLKQNPTSSTISCYEQCGENEFCEGVLFKGSCDDGQGFGGQEREFPGMPYCEATGAGVISLAQGIGCTVEAIYCVCYQ